MLATVVEKSGADRAKIAAAWPAVTVHGTRGLIRLVRAPGINNWQWAWPPVQIADRDPHDPRRFRVLAQVDQPSVLFDDAP
jgi:hypothetical protein